MASKKLDDAPCRGAAANYGVLPIDDVLYEVLLRLPAKDLCRLRLVCRHWRSLTSDPLFAKAHQSRQRHLVAVLRRSGGSPEVHVLDLSGNILKRVHLGERLYYCFDFNAQLDMVCVQVSWGQTRVVNLVTGEVIAGVITREHKNIYSVLTPRFILGRVPASGEYKVLCIYSMNKGNGERTRRWCDVMTLGDDDGGRQWRARPDATLPVAVSYTFRTAVVRGVAYFILKNELDSGNIEPDSIASFDFAKEEWRSTILKGPLSSSLAPIAEEKHYWSWSHFMLAGLGDCLVTVHRNSRDCSTDLWFIDNQGVDDTLPLWTKRYSIPWEHSWRSIRPLQVLDDGRIIIWVEDAKVLRSYDPSTSMWHDFFTDSRAGSLQNKYRQEKKKPISHYGVLGP
ncbi:hypothetical protein EJB05_00180, partial [Eragrostis curvula]